MLTIVTVVTALDEPRGWIEPDPFITSCLADTG